MSRSDARPALAALALMFPMLTGCFGAVDTAPSEDANAHIIGTWEELATGPGGRADLLATTSGLVLVQRDYMQGTEVVPARIFEWREGWPSFELVRELRIGVIATAAIGDVVFLLAHEESQNHRSGEFMRMKRLDLQTRALTTDPVVEDDRLGADLIDGAVAEVAKGVVYVFGGCCTRPPSAWSYDPETFEFKRESALPHPPEGRASAYPTVLAVGDSLLVAAAREPRRPSAMDDGLGGVGLGPPPESSSFEIHAFHPSDGTWTPKTSHPDPTPLSFLDGDAVWGLGTNCVTRIDPESGEYKTVAHPLRKGGHEADVTWRGQHLAYLSLNMTVGLLHKWTPPSMSEWESHDLPCDLSSR